MSRGRRKALPAGKRPPADMHRKDMERAPYLQFREVLVTGGTGFVGSHVCRALIARGYLPRLLIRPGSEDRIAEDLRGKVRFASGDITDREAVENAARSTDAVVHLVGIIREFPKKGITFERLHVIGTGNALEAARTWRIPRFVHMSALGARSDAPTAYFETKWRAEELVRRSGLQYTIFRPSIVFGPGDSFINELARILRAAPVVPVFGDGTYPLQPVYAGDVAAGFAEAIAKPQAEGRAFEVGGPERYTYNELLDAVAAAVGRRRTRKVHVPLPLVRTAVRSLERFRRFPLTTDQLTMLLEGSVCESAPFYAAFGITPLPLSRYLADGLGRDFPDLKKGLGEGRGAEDRSEPPRAA
jgi:uncharacterized protein YbjT (DUF2867 family)